MLSLVFKRKRQPRQGQLVVVDWEDCFSRDRWSTLDELHSDTDYPIKTVGWFIGVTESVLPKWILATGLGQVEGGSASHFGSSWYIPVNMITGWKAA